MNERRTAADFVAAICGLTESASSLRSALVHAAASVRGPGAEELRQAVAGHDVERDAPDRFDQLAQRWSAPCLASLATAIRSGTDRQAGIGVMRNYLEACAVADATGSPRPLAGT